jgi:hypothetical protein
MTWKLEQAQAYFQAALHNAVFWQNKCVDLYEIIELFCLDAQATPQQRPWAGLTKDQFLEAARLAENGNYLVAFNRIQQWLKEGNT